MPFSQSQHDYCVKRLAENILLPSFLLSGINLELLLSRWDIPHQLVSSGPSAKECRPITLVDPGACRRIYTLRLGCCAGSGHPTSLSGMLAQDRSQLPGSCLCHSKHASLVIAFLPYLLFTTSLGEVMYPGPPSANEAVLLLQSQAGRCFPQAGMLRCQEIISPGARDSLSSAREMLTSPGQLLVTRPVPDASRQHGSHPGLAVWPGPSTWFFVGSSWVRWDASLFFLNTKAAGEGGICSSSLGICGGFF